MVIILLLALIIKNKDQLIYPDTDLGLAYIIKTAKHGYDGKGQALIKCKTDLKNIDDSFFPFFFQKCILLIFLA